ncbi:MAG: GTPase ObgE [Phycisphaerales bacterium]|nr:MAG: GTPase ObgE [Phycisphaerales bacterium]
MLVDRAEIYVRGGNGGHGCVSFRREKFTPQGGPDGGDGGNGGSVFVEATPGVDTLLDFAGRHHWVAENGRPGEGRLRHGRNGADLRIKLPPGTLVYDRQTGVQIKDLAHPADCACVARGGKGGRGNKAFATATHQAPREAGPAEPGEERWLRLELKLIADVGVVGLPNAGKSTLLSRLSRARPKIADYPFTTLEPQLGIVELSDDRRFVVADIPGLIQGAHEGAGLGHEFLRHIERTLVLLHLIDVGNEDGGLPPVRAYHTIRDELRRHSSLLAGKPELIVANKIDLIGGTETARRLARELGREVVPISAATGRGLGVMRERLWSLLSEGRREQGASPGSSV